LCLEVNAPESYLKHLGRKVGGQAKEDQINRFVLLRRQILGGAKEMLASCRAWAFGKKKVNYAAGMWV